MSWAERPLRPSHNNNSQEQLLLAEQNQPFNPELDHVRVRLGFNPEPVPHQSCSMYPTVSGCRGDAEEANRS